MQLHEAERVAWQAALARDADLQRDLAKKKRHGIVHTPPELARFVVRAADQCLREVLELGEGVADARVQVIDPACGPGAFLAAVLQQCSVAGLRLRSQLTGIDVDADALTLAAELQPLAPAGQLLLRHADTLRDPQLLAAGAFPTDRVRVVLGNPPWASAPAPTPAMQALLEAFRRDGGGVRLPEKKLGVLSDAYVRFFRWAAELARQSSAGAVIGFVSNGSFLDGLVHRGMRAALCRWFDQLHVIDLGGSALLGRRGAERVRDDNVFGVRTSVAITLLCRRPGSNDERRGRLHYARLTGTSADKLALLADATLAELPFEQLALGGQARFVPTRIASRAYASWPALSEWMPFHREGVQTNRDAIVIDADPERLRARLQRFVAGSDEPLLSVANTEIAHYRPQHARRELAAAFEREQCGGEPLIRPLAYRPFDTRWLCSVAPLCHRPRPALLSALSHDAFALICVRKDRGTSPYAHVAAASHVIDNCFLSTRSSARARAFPVCTPDGAPNLDPERRARLQDALSLELSARDFACYALAVLAAPSYRERFDSELKQDYPRIPPPPNAAAWRALVHAGRSLADAFIAPLDADAIVLAELASVPDSTEARALTLRIGHHTPLADLRRRSAVSPAEDARLSALCVRLLDRLAPLDALISELIV